METLFELFNAIYPMSEGLQDYLWKHLKLRELKKGEFLLKKGHINTMGSFLHSGFLHCYYPIDDERVTSWFLKEKTLAISPKSFFSQVPSEESIEALEPCELYFITHQELQTGYKRFLELNYIIRELVQKYYVLKSEHTKELQIGKAKARYKWFVETFPDLPSQVSVRDIASFIGVKRETLSRGRNAK